MNTLKVLAAVGAGSLVAGCVAVSERADGPPDKTLVRPVVVNLVVNRDEDELVSTDARNARCTRFPDNDRYRKGCFVAAYGEILEISFRLNRPRDWRFTAFQICAGEEKPGADDCALNTEQRADFAVVGNNVVAWPDERGRVDLTGFGGSLRVFQLRDFNWTPGTYFYRIQACEEEKVAEVEKREVACAWMDPGGVNNGRGRT